MKSRIQQLAASFAPSLIEIRRHLHQHPELSFQEFETMAFVCNELDKMGIPYEKGVAGTGVVGLIKGQHPDKNCVAIRGDMDALPIQEQNDVSYKSNHDGIMHACGHDVHTTCLLGAAKILNEIKDQLEGTIKLIFQPGEELSPGGANLMIQAGVLENPKPSAILGLHVYPDLPAGFVAFRPGQYMASADEIHITVKGKGGHAALPHKTIDPIVIASHIVIGMQQIVSRKSDPQLPTVLSFGSIRGGNTTNVIPESVILEGTLRTFDESWRQEALRLIQNIATHTAAAFDAEAIIDLPLGYPSLFNDPEVTERSKSLAKDYLGTDKVEDLALRMTAEDFSFYTHHTKGCFFRLGTNTNYNENTTPVHTPNFNVDESSIEVGAGMMAWLGYNLLK